MSTATQTQLSSPSRKLFPHLSRPMSVVNIIHSKRRASTVDLKAKSSRSANLNNVNAPPQRRTVSTPLMNDRSDSDSDPDEHQHPSLVKTPAALHKLTFPHVANIFVKLRRVQKKVKAHHFESTSGRDVVTNPVILNSIGEPDVTKRLARLEIQDVYVCSDGVDVAKLLRASRATLLERAGPVNVLLDEQWTCSICGPKHRSDGSFRVHASYLLFASPRLIRYAATAATSTRRDPGQPVAVDKISDIPGLMTIIQRDTAALTIVQLFEDAQIVQN